MAGSPFLNLVSDRNDCSPGVHQSCGPIIGPSEIPGSVGNPALALAMESARRLDGYIAGRLTIPKAVP